MGQGRRPESCEQNGYPGFSDGDLFHTESNNAASSKATPECVLEHTGSSIRHPLERQGTALSIRWGQFSEVDYEEIARGLPATSLFMLHKRNPVRMAAVYIVTSKYFDMFILAMILANCITLAMYSHQPGFEATQLGQFLDATEYFFLAVFSLEMVLKVVAMGFVLAPYTYLRSGWNILDAVVVALGYVDVFMTGSSVTALRAVRVLRPLRTITHIKGLRVPVLTLLHALPMLSDVAILCLFALFVFGIIAVQIFAGALRNRCSAADFSTAYLDNSSFTYQNVSYQLPLSGNDQQCSGYHATDLVWLPAAGSNTSNGNNSSAGVFAVWSGGYAGGGWTCPATPAPQAPNGMFCAPYGNPNGGMTSFDSVLWAWLTIFQCITQEGWTDVMYWLQDAVSPWVFIYFVVLIVTGSFFLINLALAVLYLQFTKEFSVAPAASAAVTRSSSLAAGAASFLQEAASQRHLDLHPEDLQQQQGKTAGASTECEFAGIPPFNAATSPKQTPRRVDWGGLQGSSNLAAETGTCTPCVPGLAGQLTDVDGFVTAEVNLSKPTSGTMFSQPAHKSPQVHKSAMHVSRQQVPECNSSGHQQQQPSTVSCVGRCCNGVWRPLRQGCRAAAESGWFGLFTLVVILANTAVMAAASYPENPRFTHASEILNIVFTLYFALELLIKLVGLGPRRYIRDRMSQFDALVVAASLVEVGFQLAPGEDANTSSMSVLRVTRLMRVFKLARSWKELNRIISAVMRSFSQVCYLSLLLLLFVYIIALMGMQLFGYKFSGCTVPGAQQLCPPGTSQQDCPLYPDCYVPCATTQVFSWISVPGSPYNGVAFCEQFPRNSSYWGNATHAMTLDNASQPGTFSYFAQVGKAAVPHSRFDNIGWALLSVFQLVTTENWNTMMYSGMAATSPAAALWFIAAIIIGNYVLLNLFLAVLLENFGTSSSDNSNGSKTMSSGSTHAIAAQAALTLSWMRELLESSWIAKLVNGSYGNKIHPRRAAGTHAAIEDWDDATGGLGGSHHAAAAPLDAKDMQHLVEMCATASQADTTLDSNSLGTPGAVHPAVSSLPVDDGWVTGRDKSFCLGVPVSPRGLPEQRRFTALVAPLPNSSINILKLASTNGVGNRASSFAVVRSGGSVPRFSKIASNQVAPGFGVESSAGNYSATILQGNVNLLQAKQRIVADSSMLKQQQGSDRREQCAKLAGCSVKQQQQCEAAYMLGSSSDLRWQGSASGGHSTKLGASGNWDNDPYGSMHARSAAGAKLQGMSCCLFDSENWLRRKLASLVSHKQFENAILGLIFLSSITLALEMPSLDRDGLLYQTLERLDMVFAVLFALEALVRTLVMGFALNGPGSYLRNPWNVLDFLIVVIGIIMMAVTLGGGDIHSLSSLRALRTLRALRPLRVASRLLGMKVVVDALFASLPPLGNIMLVCMLFYLVFGIMGVHLLAGRLHSCQDAGGNIIDAAYVLPAGQYITREWCENASLEVTTSAYHAGINVTMPAYTPQTVWVNRVANFDNILMAILTLFQISTTELWIDTMYDSVAAVGVGQQPRDNYNPALALFFVVFIIFGSFFVLQLFIATALEQFAKMQQEKGRSVLLTAQQEEWLTIQRMIAEVNLKTQPVPLLHSRWRTAVFRVVMSSYCELLIMAVIILNVLVMALTHADMDERWQDFMSYANVVFTAFFTVEAVVKFIALGLKQYLRNVWCRFDLFVVLVSIGGIAVDLGTPHNLEVLPLLRVLRLVRVFRLIPKAEGLQHLLQTLIFSLPALGNIGGVLLLFFFIYAVVGMNLFGAVKHGLYLNRHANFENVGMALLVLFRMITGESWNGIMQDCMNTSSCIEVTQEVSLQDNQVSVVLSEGTWLDANDARLSQLPANAFNNRCSPVPIAAVIYFCSFVLLCGLVLVNFVIGVIIDNMQSSNNYEDMPVSRSQIDRFVRAWSELDPTATHYIPAVELSTVLRELPPPMGVKGEDGEQAKLQSIIMSIDIPVRKKNQVYFLETLHALAGRVAGTPVPEGEEIKVHQKMFSRLPTQSVDPRNAPKYSVAHFYAALYVQAAVRGFLRRHELRGAGAVSGFQSINLRALGLPEEQDAELDSHRSP